MLDACSTDTCEARAGGRVLGIKSCSIWPSSEVTSYRHKRDVPNSVSVSDSAHCFWLLLASDAYPETRMSQRPSALASTVSAWGSGGRE
jgi:hypothetical protein